MAKRRNLKKTINYIASSLFMECMAYEQYIPGVDKAKLDELMGRVLMLQDDFLARVSHTEPGNVKGYYKKLRVDFDQEVRAIFDAMEQLKA